MKDKRSGTPIEPNRSQSSNDRQLEGGSDVDTTDLDGPSSLGRGGVPAGDPTGDDPFIPGAEEASMDIDAEVSETYRMQDSQGPTYEAGQGNIAEDHGGSTDPNSSLIESTIRSEDSHDTKGK